MYFPCKRDVGVMLMLVFGVQAWVQLMEQQRVELELLPWVS